MSNPIDPAGRITVFAGKVEIGQGILTALAQIAAEELDVSVQSIRLVSGDTTLTPDEGYTSGSRSIEDGGTALRLACAEARAILLEKGKGGNRVSGVPNRPAVRKWRQSARISGAYAEMRFLPLLPRKKYMLMLKDIQRRKKC